MPIIQPVKSVGKGYKHQSPSVRLQSMRLLGGTARDA